MDKFFQFLVNFLFFGFLALLAVTKPDAFFVSVCLLSWLIVGLFVWFIWAEGIFFLSWWRTGYGVLIFVLLGPIGILAFPIEKFVTRHDKIN